MPDYPLTRAAFICPVCNHAKDSGLIVCWTCYRALDARNRPLRPAIVAILDHAEADALRDELARA